MKTLYFVEAHSNDVKSLFRVQKANWKYAAGYCPEYFTNEGGAHYWALMDPWNQGGEAEQVPAKEAKKLFPEAFSSK
jgi:hypothetical protein